MTPRPRWLRQIFAVLLLAVAMLFGGCIYLRLLQLKNQLADFEKHFTVASTDGITIGFKDPVLYGDDVKWLGAEPEIVRRTETGEHWVIRWLKETPPGTKEPGTYDVQLNADLSNRKLTVLQIPERYFAFVSKDLFLGALRSAGHAQVDRQTRAATMTATPENPQQGFPPVAQSSIEEMLGVPTQRLVEESSIRYRYVFKPQTPSGSGKPVEVHFIFGRQSHFLRRVIGKLPRGTLTFDFPEPTRKESPVNGNGH